jgi:hypothetical protein
VADLKARHEKEVSKAKAQQDYIDMEIERRMSHRELKANVSPEELAETDKKILSEVGNICKSVDTLAAYFVDGSRLSWLKKTAIKKGVHAGLGTMSDIMDHEMQKSRLRLEIVREILNDQKERADADAGKERLAE